MSEPEWILDKTEETTAPIPGRPQFLERRVRKEYVTSLRRGTEVRFVRSAQLVEFECPCGGGTVGLDIEDGAEIQCPVCGRRFEFEYRIRRFDAANIPPPGVEL